ncbi:THUMP domain-containing class I SAM-dependent RNA methyltransferase [Acetanaerobacterium elongatum]|uniref:Putative N6-adenine-specific DNA methylase n=1 Tax=Acetanaerobacterium elongatum TaxID=258515 RepID=A0A1H0A9L2_9FIRM|nr:class I SAM-dependent RNA methyltransferase [Acetanaerobacterium elongatum]SDN29924.1 putative N6-adenine-specific DNA methylase [Acetanaerobacterium elongatum]
MKPFTISCPCIFGLEGILADEIKRFGGQNVAAQNGRVLFEGSEEDVARANLYLRTAERVLIVLGTFQASSFEELFQGVLQLPLEEFIGKKDAFPVKGWSLNSQLHSVPDCQAIIKKAAVRRLEGVYHQSWFEETGPIHQIQFSILKDEVTVMLDTSGAGLHKRGYRKDATEAPIKETLAAGIANLARVKGSSTVYDPFCGSGTFLIESALYALNIAPGISRHFTAEGWDCFSAAVWKRERERAMESIDRHASFAAYGSDILPDAVALTTGNAKKAGVISRIKATVADIKDFTIPTESAIVLCNPPYGERLLDIKQAEELYKVMGRMFEKRPRTSYYIISPHEEFERLFGRPADKRRKLYNGMIKCQLYMYFK